MVGYDVAVLLGEAPVEMVADVLGVAADVTLGVALLAAVADDEADLVGGAVSEALADTVCVPVGPALLVTALDGVCVLAAVAVTLADGDGSTLTSTELPSSRTPAAMPAGEQLTPPGMQPPAPAVPCVMVLSGPDSVMVLLPRARMAMLWPPAPAEPLPPLPPLPPSPPRAPLAALC